MYVRRMRQNTPRVILEPVPLFQKVIAAMVADFFDHFAVSYRDLREVWRINDQFTPSARTGSSLYMHLPATHSSSYIGGAHDKIV